MFNLKPNQNARWSQSIGRLLAIAGVIPLTALVGGCFRDPSFSENKVFVKRLEVEIGEPLPEQALADVQYVMDKMFGTADQPVLPEALQTQQAQIVSLDNLQRAAGRVYSDENDVHFGLYRKHCIRCHGTSGDGRGPAARLLSPYPRDFRLGKYKFKSTAQGTKPTKQDLMRTLRHGIPGTSMPNFALLPDEDIDALTDYVIYLSVRGETERDLLRQVANMLDYSRGDRIFDENWRESDPGRHDTQLRELSKIAATYLGQWRVDAQPSPVRPEGFPVWEGPYAKDTVIEPLLLESIARGKEAFNSSLASCAKCHGADGTGRTAPRDYDLWTKDWTLAAGIDPQDKDAIRPMLKAGALKPVQLYPRNLNLGIFRGGNRPEDIYTRIVHGIEGTSMPAAALQSPANQGLTPDQVWDLVNYVLSLADMQSTGRQGASTL